MRRRVRAQLRTRGERSEGRPVLEGYFFVIHLFYAVGRSSSSAVLGKRG